MFVTVCKSKIFHMLCFRHTDISCREEVLERDAVLAPVHAIATYGYYAYRKFHILAIVMYPSVAWPSTPSCSSFRRSPSKYLVVFSLVPAFYPPHFSVYQGIFGEYVMDGTWTNSLTLITSACYFHKRQSSKTKDTLWNTVLWIETIKTRKCKPRLCFQVWATKEIYDPGTSQRHTSSLPLWQVRLCCNWIDRKEDKVYLGSWRVRGSQ